MEHYTLRERVLGKQTSGSLLSIAAGGERSISSDICLGLGKTVITVSATHPYSSVVATQNATILLFYIEV